MINLKEELTIKKEAKSFVHFKKEIFIFCCSRFKELDVSLFGRVKIESKL